MFRDFKINYAGLCFSAECEIILGRPATRLDPEEYEELVLNSVFLWENEQDITDLVIEANYYDKIKELCEDEISKWGVEG